MKPIAQLAALSISLLFVSPSDANADLPPCCTPGVILPPCCVVPTSELLPGLDLQARAIRGPRWYLEGNLHYQLRYNQAFTTLLTTRDWQTLTALNAMSDRQLCGESCAEAPVDLRHIVEAAIVWKNAQDAGGWSEKLYIVAFEAMIVSIISGILTALTLDWFQFFHVRIEKQATAITPKAFPKLGEPLYQRGDALPDWRYLLRQRLHAMSANQRIRRS